MKNYEFEKGSKIVCVNTGNLKIETYFGSEIKPPVNNLTLNKIYYVLNDSQHHDEIGIEVIADDGYSYSYQKDRFKPVGQIRKEKIEKILL